jgi:hypothetical protein
MRFLFRSLKCWSTRPFLDETVLAATRPLNNFVFSSLGKEVRHVKH